MSNFNTYSSETIQAIHALYQALGQPTIDNTSIASITDSGYGVDGLHPVFALAEHYRSHDEGNAGYTYNRYRGDHISIPAFTEEGDVVIIELSFHKGMMICDYLTYPNGDNYIHQALYDLLRKLETR